MSKKRQRSKKARKKKPATASTAADGVREDFKVFRDQDSINRQRSYLSDLEAQAIKASSSEENKALANVFDREASVLRSVPPDQDQFETVDARKRSSLRPTMPVDESWALDKIPAIPHSEPLGYESLTDCLIKEPRKMAGLMKSWGAVDRIILRPNKKNQDDLWDLTPTTLTWLSAKAAENGLTEYLTIEECDALKKGGLSTVTSAWRMRTGDVQDDFIRLIVLLLLDGSKPIQHGENKGRFAKPTAETFIDVTPELFHFLERSYSTNPVETDAKIVGRNLPNMPQWENARAFPKVWDKHLAAIAETTGMKRKTRSDVMNRTIARLGEPVLKKMAEAHVLSVDRRQADVLPAFESAEEYYAFLDELQLPFDPLFIDLEDVGGLTPIVTSSKNPPPGMVSMDASITGALVEMGTGPLRITPFGTLTSLEGKEMGINDPYTSFGTFTTAYSEGISLYGTNVTELRIPVPWYSVAASELPNLAYLAGSPPDTPIHPTAFERGTLELALPLNDDGLLHTVENLPRHMSPPEGDYDTLAFIQALASSVLLAQSYVVAKILYLLNSANVDLIEGNVSRQVRRNAERHGTPLKPSLVVSIRANKKRYTWDASGSGGISSSNGDGHMEFSHRFEVIGHYKHFGPETRMSLAKPQEVKPCWRRDPRTGEKTCPLGCRRIWTPSFIKGDESLPFIPKTRRMRAPQ